MSRIYAMSEPSACIIAELKDGLIPGLKHWANTDKDSLWQDGVTDGINYGFFENQMLLFWGGNKESYIMKKLGKVGVFCDYIG